MRVPALELLLGGQPDAEADLARLASPVFQADAHAPPLLLIHGDQDPQMPINQAHELQGRYETLRLRCFPNGTARRDATRCNARGATPAVLLPGR